MKSNKDQTAVFLNECRQMGIAVLVPDVNESESDFSVRPGGSPDVTGPLTTDGMELPRKKPKEIGAIRFGMSAVRNVGEGVVSLIVAAREETGPFTDFYDFCERVDPQALNKRTIESLIKAGGFDSLGYARQGLLLVFEQIVTDVLTRRGKEAEGQFDLFSTAAEAAPESVMGQHTPIGDSEFPKSVRLALEKEMLGLYVSDHPLMGAERGIASLHRLHALRAEGSRGKVRCGWWAASSPRWPASTPSVATSWPRSCSRTSARRWR